MNLNIVIGVLFVAFSAQLAVVELTDIGLAHRLLVVVGVFWAGARLILHDTTLIMPNSRWKAEPPELKKFNKLSTALILLFTVIIDFVVSAFMLGPGLVLLVLSIPVMNPIAFAIGGMFTYYAWTSFTTTIDPNRVIGLLER